jgi:hypothetical protein
MSSFGDLVEMRPIDWYDGIVTGLVTFSNDARWFYASMLGWSMDLSEKIYALVPLREESVERLLSLLRTQRAPFNADIEEWNSIQREAYLLKRSISGKVAIVRCRELDSGVLSLAEVDIDENGLREALGQDVEMALAEGQAERWLELLATTQR